ncbi:MAG: GDSL-type esterase/lipase family protein [Treponema sp.]|nr:GDSL-type esterase/lipase family protein [Treponema sp.]
MGFKARRFVLFPLIVLYCTGYAGGQTTSSAMPIPNVSPNDPAVVPASRIPRWWVTRHNEKTGNVILNQKIVFIGDSITEGYEGTEAWKILNKKYNNRITNLGFSGDSTGHVIWRLENGEFPKGINPEYVVLMIGTNNKNAPEAIAAGIGKIIKIINNNSPKSKILLFSILPCGSGLDDQNTIKNNNVNKIIKNYHGFFNVRYIDIANYYINSRGELIQELFAKDRLHLVPEGYTVWNDRITAIIDSGK